MQLTRSSSAVRKEYDKTLKATKPMNDLDKNLNKRFFVRGKISFIGLAYGRPQTFFHGRAKFSRGAKTY